MVVCLYVYKTGSISQFSPLLFVFYRLDIDLGNEAGDNVSCGQ